MRRAAMVATVVLALSSSAFAQANPDHATPGPAKTNSRAAVTDRQFVVNVSRDGLAEVALGKLASTRGSSPQVKQFGERMVADHGKAGAELKGIAAKKNIAVPAKLDAKHAAERKRLMTLSGDAFDRAYMEAMVGGHGEALAAFKREANEGTDPEIKAFAAKTLPILEEHFKMANEASRAVALPAGAPQSQ